jgi:hypothetical protein
LAKQGLISDEALSEALIQPQVPFIPVAPPERSDAEYVDELARIVPANLLQGLGTEYVAELVRHLRKKDEAIRGTVDKLNETSEHLNKMAVELGGLRSLAKDLALSIGRDEESGELVGEFEQDLLFNALKSGEDLLVVDYAQQLQEKAALIPQANQNGDDFSDPRYTVSGNLHAFRAKVDIIAKQEANRQGLTYKGSLVNPHLSESGVSVALEFEAEPGRQLDRARLKQLLGRHKPVGTTMEMFANVRVKVPL